MARVWHIDLNGAGFANSRSTPARSLRSGATGRTELLERQVVGAPPVDHDLVFTTIEGEPLNPRAVSQAFQVRRRQANLPHVRLHDLRHGAAMLAVEGDVNLELIRRRLGHSRIATTIDLYARHDRVG